MPQQPRIRVGVILEGKTAESFMAEMDATLAQAAPIARAAIEKYLADKGYPIEGKRGRRKIAAYKRSGS